MCEFCHQHGEGQKWYLNSANFAAELFDDAAKRSAVDVMGALMPTPPKPRVPNRAELFAWQHARRLAQWVVRRHQRDVHWGQVVPIEDAHALVDMLDFVVRLPCTCRAATIGDRNARYCFGIGVAEVEEPWRKLFRESVDPSLSLERLTRAQAKEALTDLDRRGAVHSVWTFKSPYIGGICNCDLDCNAIQAQITWKYPIMFRAEYVARVDPERCNGCRQCMRQCLFGGLSHSLSSGKCAVNDQLCYGCGLCRAACKQGAISLLPRAAVPAAAGLWEL